MSTARAGGAFVEKTLEAFGKLQAGRLYVARKTPYYRSGIVRLVPHELPGLDTVAVDGRGRLYWDGAAIDRWHKETAGAHKIGGAMAHELLHVLLKHEARGIKIGALSEEKRKRWNRACDLTINQMLRAGGWQLPDGVLYPEQFKGFPKDATAEQYYALLEEHDEQAAQKQKGKGKGQPQQGAGSPQGGQAGEPGEGGASTPAGGGGNAPGDPSGATGGAPAEKPGVGAGWCGGCAGRPVPGEHPADAPPLPGDATEADLERMRRAVAASIREHAAKHPGTMPAELDRWAQELLAPPKVRWQDKLARNIRGGIAICSGITDYTRTRPARRQFGIGVGVGKPLVAAMHSRKPRVCFAIDTSASMGTAELRLAASEVDGVLRAIGTPIEFMSCDTKIHASKVVKRWQDMVDAVIGGGGTSFVPVFQKLQREGFKGVVIFATDGHGAAPAVQPPGIHTIWLLVGEGTKHPCTWGDVVEVTDD